MFRVGWTRHWLCLRLLPFVSGGSVAPAIYLIGPIVTFILNVALYGIVGHLIDKLLIVFKR
jgi:hypothetical protein